MEEELEVYMEGMEEEEPDETHDRKFRFERYIFYFCGVLLALSIGLLILSFYFPGTIPEKYGLGGIVGSAVLFTLGYFCLMCRGNFGQRRASIWPFGFNRRTAQGGQHVRVRRRNRTGHRRHISVERASASSRVPLINPASGPQSSQLPGIHFSGGHSCHDLQPDQERTRSESPLPEERSRLLAPGSRESSTTPKISDVAVRVSDIASKNVPRRQGMLTRSLSKQGSDADDDNASKSSAAAQNIDPTVPGPSCLHSAEIHDSSEHSVRLLRSGVKKTGSESQQSKRQTVLKSPVSGRSTTSRKTSEEAATSVSDVASGLRRRREKFADRKASAEEQPVSDDKSLAADYERRCRSSLM